MRITTQTWRKGLSKEKENEDMFRKFGAIAALGALLAAPGVALAQDTTGVPQESAFVFNSLLFLVGGFLVMWMAAGFTMLEAGFVRTRNAAAQCLKGVGIYAISSLAFFILAYNLMYPGDGWIIDGVLGAITWTSLPGPGATSEVEDITYASLGSDFFFQLVFCATTASIVSGAIAERMRVGPFFVFTAVMTLLIYPIQASWKWGGGWLDGIGFADFAGSTIVHSVGGWAALTGVIILGARSGKYGTGGRVMPIPASNLPLATLGTFILWLGWFGFNGGSQLAMGTLSDASDVSRIFANTNNAAAAGAVVVMLITRYRYGRIDLTLVLNGALAGLVAITAEPLTPSLWASAIIGAIGGAIVVFCVPLLDRFKIDDVVGAIPVHLAAGIWGTLAVPITNPDASFVAQLIGIVAIGAFVVATSVIAWLVIKAVIGLRVSEEEELAGIDSTELGLHAYPEWTSSS